MARYIDGHKPTRANPDSDTLLVVAAVGVGGFFLYSAIKGANGINVQQVVQAAVAGATQAIGDALGAIDSCAPPFDKAYWSQALQERMAADRRFWCIVELWVKSELADVWLGPIQTHAPDPTMARNWDAFRQWYMGMSRPWAPKPDPGAYGPAEFFAYAMTQAGAGGGGGGGGGGSW